MGLAGYLGLLGLLAASSACKGGTRSATLDSGSASRVATNCSADGAFPGEVHGGSCPAVRQLAVTGPDLELFYAIESQSYKGTLPPCAPVATSGPGQKFKFHIEDITFERNDQTVSSRLSGRNLDVSPQCGVVVTLTSTSEKIDLSIKRDVVVRQRIINRDDKDNPYVAGLFDEDGTVIYATILGARLDLLPSDFADELGTLSVTATGTSVCTSNELSETLVQLSLSTDGQPCALDSHSARCCELWGRTYEVQLLYAVGPRPLQPYVYSGFAIRAPGTFVPADGP